MDESLLNELYEIYKIENRTLKEIGQIANLDRTTIGKYFKHNYGQEYQKLARSKLRIKKLTEEQKKEVGRKISKKLKGRQKPTRTTQHRKNLSLAFKGRNYNQRFGDKAELIIAKIKNSNKGKKKQFKDKESWRKNLSNSLKGRNVWNKGKKGLQKAWNKKELPTNDILNMYCNENISSPKIAKKFNVNQSTIQKILKDNSIKLKGSINFTKEGKQKDIIRDYYLKKAGWEIFRFKSSEIERDYLFEKTKENMLNILQNG